MLIGVLKCSKHAADFSVSNYCMYFFILVSRCRSKSFPLGRLVWHHFFPKLFRLVFLWVLMTCCRSFFYLLCVWYYNYWFTYLSPALDCELFEGRDHTTVISGVLMPGSSSMLNKYLMRGGMDGDSISLFWFCFQHPSILALQGGKWHSGSQKSGWAGNWGECLIYKHTGWVGEDGELFNVSAPTWMRSSRERPQGCANMSAW